MFRPRAIFKRITDIPVDFFTSNNIKGIIIDVDNTLIDLDRVPLDNLNEWILNIKNNGIKICIASNSIKKGKVKKIADDLQIPFVYFSKKPLKSGLNKAIKILDLNSEEIAEIGDQLFTDVLGSNRLKMFSILTEPIGEEKFFVAKIKRNIEKKVLDKQKKGENKCL